MERDEREYAVEKEYGVGLISKREEKGEIGEYTSDL